MAWKYDKPGLMKLLGHLEMIFGFAREFLDSTTIDSRENSRLLVEIEMALAECNRWVYNPRILKQYRDIILIKKPILKDFYLEILSKAMLKELQPLPISLQDSMFANERELNDWILNQKLPENSEANEISEVEQRLDKEIETLASELSSLPITEADLPSGEFLDALVAFYLSP